MNRGFTLIETILYLALYAIIISGAIISVYSIAESAARNRTTAMLEEEVNFLVAKIDDALENAHSVSSPVREGGTLTVLYQGGTTESIYRSGKELMVSENGAAAESLNNGGTSIIEATFTRTARSGSVSFEADITLSATDTNGMPVTREFSTVHYENE